MNKKADIPITILVIGVFALCVLTIFSFISNNNDSQKTFAGVGLIETMYSFEKEISFNNIHGFNNFNSMSELIGSSKLFIEVEEDLINATYGKIVSNIKIDNLISIEYHPID